MLYALFDFSVSKLVLLYVQCSHQCIKCQLACILLPEVKASLVVIESTKQKDKLLCSPSTWQGTFQKAIYNFRSD
jgi:hypothetical protein